MNVEQQIIDLATKLWVNHRRHEEGRRPPNSEDLGLNLYWTGNNWYASVCRWPARTPGRRIGVYARNANAALADLRRELTEESRYV